MYSEIQKYCSTCPNPDTSLSPHFSACLTWTLITEAVVITNTFGLPVTLQTGFQMFFSLQTIADTAVLCAIQDEMLMEQGANFTSRLMQVFYKQMANSAIKITP